MSHSSLMADLQKCVGRPVNHCIDDIESVAHKHGYSVNIIDPEFNVGSIDNDDSRLNVRTDRDGKVKSFSIG